MVFQTKTSVILILLCCLFTVSCSKGTKTVSTVQVNAEILPRLHGENVSSLISDSGITRYRMQAAVWDIYSNDTTDYWHFPQGVYMEKFDSLFHVEGSIQADTAYYFERIGLWKLVGNVFIENLVGDQFKTSELFWNSREPASSINSIYTDQYLWYQINGQIGTAQGLRSNQSMTKRKLYGNSQEVIIDEEQSDSIPPVQKNTGG